MKKSVQFLKNALTLSVVGILMRGLAVSYNAYVNRMGSYPTRKSRDASEFNPKYSYADLNLLPTDLAFVNYNYLDVQDFWTYYSDVFKK